MTTAPDILRQAAQTIDDRASERDHPNALPEAESMVSRYINLCAAMYQAAGAFGMPERFLDALSDAASGDIEKRRRTEDLLPCLSPRAVGVEELEALQRFELREDEGNCWINWDELRALIERAGGGVRP